MNFLATDERAKRFPKSAVMNVVHFGYMGALVLKFCMSVPMGMEFAWWICRAVDMLVVSIVNVQIGMLYRIMLVHVFVVFR